MNILFFLLPKKNVEYIENSFTIRQTLEKMEFHKYTSIPVIDKNGKYVGIISDGDILRYLRANNITWEDTNKLSIELVPVFRTSQSISIDMEMIDLVSIIINQNFVPVVDDTNNFIGIITRSAVINYLAKNQI